MHHLDYNLLKRCKCQGFSDKQIALLLKTSPGLVRQLRKDAGVIPFAKQIDTGKRPRT